MDLMILLNVSALLMNINQRRKNI